MRKIARFGACLVAAGLFTACDINKVAVTVRVELESPEPAQTAKTAEVLQRRLKEIVPGYFSGVTATPSGNGVDMVFTGTAPSDELIRTYASTQGIFRMFPANLPSNVLVSDRDVEVAEVSMGPDGPTVALTVSERAGERLLTYTSRNVGNVLVISWDRKEDMRATIQGAFGRRFQTTGIDADTARMRMTFLRHGRLPVAVSSVDIRHP